jgi:hypothetical protein
MKKTVWKKGAFKATGRYERTSKSSDRVFVLKFRLSKHRIGLRSYESWQAAVKDGWKKVK